MKLYFSLEERFTYREMSKGSIMAEMIVSLSVLMMAVSLLLPQTVLVMQERKIYKFVIRQLDY